MRTRAPFLFAALLRRAGVAPALLPLLAEPARAAVHGLAITARRKRPAHTAAFLAALREVCASAGGEAAAVAAATAAAAAAVARQVRFNASPPPLLMARMMRVIQESDGSHDVCDPGVLGGVQKGMFLLQVKAFSICFPCGWAAHCLGKRGPCQSTNTLHASPITPHEMISLNAGPLMKLISNIILLQQQFSLGLVLFGQVEASAAADEGESAGGGSAAAKRTSIAEVAEYFESRRGSRNGQQAETSVREEGAASSAEPEDDKPQVHCVSQFSMSLSGLVGHGVSIHSCELHAGSLHF